MDWQIKMMQRSIKSTVSCSGVGLHTGKIANLTLKPAPVNSGIKFIRIDVDGGNEVQASFLSVSDTGFCTVLSNECGVSVMTVEHLMAALAAYRISNVIVEIDAPEVPALDGSALCFVNLIQSVGYINQEIPTKRLKMLKDVEVRQNDKSIKIRPYDGFVIDFTISFSHPSIGTQRYIFDSNKCSFAAEVAKARTFGFIEEIEMLQSRGLAKGASLKNAVGVSANGVVNDEGLRYEDEFVRHKVLDCIGDLYLAGYELIGYVEAIKSGHMLNNKLLHTIFENENNYAIVLPPIF
ncbi:MAG: UDP-3-O-acyl-N-acetylglucosamine deacetylase [Candidatus Lariskella arthropodorum]